MMAEIKVLSSYNFLQCNRWNDVWFDTLTFPPPPNECQSLHLLSTLSYTPHLDKLCWPVPQRLSVLVGAQVHPTTPSFCSSCPVHSGPPRSLALMSLAATTPGLLQCRQRSESVLVGNKCLGQGRHTGAEGAHLLLTLSCFQATFHLVRRGHKPPFWEKKKLVIAVVHLEPSTLNETNWKKQLAINKQSWKTRARLPKTPRLWPLNTG